MKRNYYPTFNLAITACGRTLLNEGQKHQSETWQAISTVDKPQLTLFEALEINFQVPMAYFMPGGYYEIFKDKKTDAKGFTSKLSEEIKPNLPWADVHFEERVGGVGLNPGKSYKIWPFYKQDDKVRQSGVFSHTYMERYWPNAVERLDYAMNGIRYPYGDLQSVVNLLRREPGTRQAYLPIFFPEDTGAEYQQRVPCTLGYLFYIRNGFLHCKYSMRSCDYFRHFRDDIYLTVLLAHWVAKQVCTASSQYLHSPLPKVKLGLLTMDISNLHIFYPEVPKLESLLKP